MCRWESLSLWDKHRIESVSFFISYWHGKIVEIVDRLSEGDQIQMVLRSLQPRIARHVVGVSFIDFSPLVLALYDVEDGISKGLWTNSSPTDVKGNKPFGWHRSTDVSALSILQVRGFPGVISQFHSLLWLTLLMHLNNIGHEHLIRLMIKFTCLLH